MNTDPLLEAILPPPDTLPAALRAVRRRRTVRHAITVSPLVIAGLAATLIALQRPAPPTLTTTPPIPTPPTIPTVRTTPSANRINTTTTFPVIRTPQQPVPTITDDHLLALASTPGHPAALVHHHGQTQLLKTTP